MAIETRDAYYIDGVLLIEGFNPRFYSEIDEYVKSQRFTFDPSECVASKVIRLTQKAQKPLIFERCVEYRSNKLQRLFWYLHGKYTNKNKLIRGDYIPFKPVDTIDSMNGIYPLDLLFEKSDYIRSID